MLLEWLRYFCLLLLLLSLTLFTSQLKWSSSIQTIPVKCSHRWWARSKPIRSSSWSSPLEVVPDLTWLALILPTLLPNSSDKNILCLRPNTTDMSWRYTPPRSKLNRLTRRGSPKRLSRTNRGWSVVGKPQTHTGLRPIPSLRIAWGEGEGRVGGNPAIVLAQTWRRWIHENKFDPEQKRILLFNRKIGLHNHTICIPPNPSPLTIPVNSHHQPNLRPQQQAQR